MIHALELWFGLRSGLSDLWQFIGAFRKTGSSRNTFQLLYDYVADDTERKIKLLPPEHAFRAFHGTKAYNVWNISEEGLRASCDASLGHDFHGNPGVFVAPTEAGADRCCYATPQNVFGNGVYLKFLFKVAIDTREISHIDPQGRELVVNQGHVHIEQLSITVNPNIQAGENRLQGYEPDLEATPLRQPPVLNTVKSRPLKSPWY